MLTRFRIPAQTTAYPYHPPRVDANLYQIPVPGLQLVKGRDPEKPTPRRDERERAPIDVISVDAAAEEEVWADPSSRGCREADVDLFLEFVRTKVQFLPAGSVSGGPDGTDGLFLMPLDSDELALRFLHRCNYDVKRARLLLLASLGGGTETGVLDHYTSGKHGTGHAADTMATRAGNRPDRSGTAAPGEAAPGGDAAPAHHAQLVTGRSRRGASGAGAAGAASASAAASTNMLSGLSALDTLMGLAPSVPAAAPSSGTNGGGTAAGGSGRGTPTSGVDATAKKMSESDKRRMWSSWLDRAQEHTSGSTPYPTIAALQELRQDALDLPVLNVFASGGGAGKLFQEASTLQNLVASRLDDAIHWRAHVRDLLAGRYTSSTIADMEGLVAAGNALQVRLPELKALAKLQREIKAWQRGASELINTKDVPLGELRRIVREAENLPVIVPEQAIAAAKVEQCDQLSERFRQLVIRQSRYYRSSYCPLATQRMLVAEARRIGVMTEERQRVEGYVKASDEWIEKAEKAVEAKVSLKDLLALLREADQIPVNLISERKIVEAEVRNAEGWVEKVRSALPKANKTRGRGSGAGDERRFADLDTYKQLLAAKDVMTDDVSEEMEEVEGIVATAEEWMKRAQDALQSDEEDVSLEDLQSLYAEAADIPVVMNERALLDAEIKKRKWVLKVRRSLASKVRADVLRDQLETYEETKSELPDASSRRNFSTPSEVSEAKRAIRAAEAWTTRYNRLKGKRSSIRKVRSTIREAEAVPVNLAAGIRDLQGYVDVGEAWTAKVREALRGTSSAEFVNAAQTKGDEGDDDDDGEGAEAAKGGAGGDVDMEGDGDGAAGAGEGGSGAASPSKADGASSPTRNVKPAPTRTTSIDTLAELLQESKGLPVIPDQEANLKALVDNIKRWMRHCDRVMAALPPVLEDGTPVSYVDHLKNLEEAEATKTGVRPKAPVPVPKVVKSEFADASSDEEELVDTPDPRPALKDLEEMLTAVEWLPIDVAEPIRVIRAHATRARKWADEAAEVIAALRKADAAYTRSVYLLNSSSRQLELAERSQQLRLEGRAAEIEALEEAAAARDAEESSKEAAQEEAKRRRDGGSTTPSGRSRSDSRRAPGSSVTSLVPGAAAGVYSALGELPRRAPVETILSDEERKRSLALFEPGARALRRDRDVDHLRSVVQDTQLDVDATKVELDRARSLVNPTLEGAKHLGVSTEEEAELLLVLETDKWVSTAGAMLRVIEEIAAGRLVGMREGEGAPSYMAEEAAVGTSVIASPPAKAAGAGAGAGGAAGAADAASSAPGATAAATTVPGSSGGGGGGGAGAGAGSAGDGTLAVAAPVGGDAPLAAAAAGGAGGPVADGAAAAAGGGAGESPVGRISPPPSPKLRAAGAGPGDDSQQPGNTFWFPGDTDFPPGYYRVNPDGSTAPVDGPGAMSLPSGLEATPRGMRVVTRRRKPLLPADTETVERHLNELFVEDKITLLRNIDTNLSSGMTPSDYAIPRKLDNDEPVIRLTRQHRLRRSQLAHMIAKGDRLRDVDRGMLSGLKREMTRVDALSHKLKRMLTSKERIRLGQPDSVLNEQRHVSVVVNEVDGLMDAIREAVEWEDRAIELVLGEEKPEAAQVHDAINDAERLRLGVPLLRALKKGAKDAKHWIENVRRSGIEKGQASIEQLHALLDEVDKLAVWPGKVVEQVSLSTQVSCMCRRPGAPDTESMVQCSRCCEFFHPMCIGVIETDARHPVWCTACAAYNALAGVLYGAMEALRVHDGYLYAYLTGRYKPRTPFPEAVLQGALASARAAQAFNLAIIAGGMPPPVAVEKFDDTRSNPREPAGGQEEPLGTPETVEWVRRHRGNCVHAVHKAALGKFPTEAEKAVLLATVDSVAEAPFALFSPVKELVSACRALAWVDAALEVLKRAQSRPTLSGLELVMDGACRVPLLDKPLLKPLRRVVTKCRAWTTDARRSLSVKNGGSMAVLKQLRADKARLPMLQSVLEAQLLSVCEQGVEPYCVCRGMNLGTLMVGCEHCDEWYHISCVGVPLALASDDQFDFTCPPCAMRRREPYRFVAEMTEAADAREARLRAREAAERRWQERRSRGELRGDDAPIALGARPAVVDASETDGGAELPPVPREAIPRASAAGAGATTRSGADTRALKRARDDDDVPHGAKRDRAGK